ncbi:hypothetical protein D1007_01882 [Hordeum vulgare]|nr:hypothetical protein D1007_01882 [Hordeum vulgare]
MTAVPNDEELLFVWVYRWLLTTAETNTRWLRRKKTKVLCLGIEQSERTLAEAKVEVARVAKLKRNQGRIFRRFKVYIVITSSSFSDGSDLDDLSPTSDLSGGLHQSR